MFGRRKTGVAGVAVVLAVAAFWIYAGNPPSHAERRATLTKAFQAGNWKDAYDGLRKLALDPTNHPHQVGNDLSMAITCLQRLGRSDEVDEFREAVIGVHTKNWRLLEAAAQSFVNGERYGFIVAGKFHRGHHRGGGRMVNSQQRDRTRALQLMQQALDFTKTENDKAALAQFHLRFANMLLTGNGFHEPWRLQYLTDLTQLPDYEEGYFGYRGSNAGAPVDEKGNPVFHHLPKSYGKAASDGERWRWLLVQAVEFNPDLANEVDTNFANFLRQQFGEQTMAYLGFRGGDNAKQKDGTFSLHTLKDDETIARLANGVKRFKLPDEFNWIKIYQRIANRGRSTFGAAARDAIATIHEDRRQYVPAAQDWQTAIAEYGPGDHNFRQNKLEQIIGNWGRFEPGKTQPAGQAAVVDFRFRNGKKVSFEAFEIKVGKLLADVKAYLKNNPGVGQGGLDWHTINVGDIGYRLVQRNERQYLGAKAAAWNLDLKPRPKHVDERITVTTPLKKPGAYLLTAKMANGHVSRIIVWVSDTVIVRKQLEGKNYYYVADAVSGQPLAKSNVEFFGYKVVNVQPGRPVYRVVTNNFAEFTDGNGQVILDQKNLPSDFTWLIIARSPKNDPNQDRLAYFGFTGVWYGAIHDPEYNQTRVFALTDRPVYRPGQNVHFKLWVRHAKYDQADTSSFASQDFTVQINNPMGEKVLEKTFTSDAYGGIEGELALSKGTKLGMYHFFVKKGGAPAPQLGGGHFRVEEYKKPEFEVLIDAPKEPVMLGEKIAATIKAKYYFGAPVTKATVKYKVLRTSHSARWYPRGTWDWLYGRGYWWFAPDHAWYPGWGAWGCARPFPIWWHRGWQQPEVVMENEVPIDADGTVKVEIDTTPAKELHPDQDHRYSITAEVVDESRRTIVGTGDVLVARKPFQVFAWLNSGHYRVGDTIQAHFSAHTLDKKPVEGRGKLTLFQISYDDKNQPVEKAVQTWNLDTNVEGKAHQQIKASKAGQYRLSYQLTDAKKHTIEGGYLFLIRGEGFDGHEFRFNDIELITDKREYAPGDKIKLLINTNRNDGVVVLFVRPTNGIYLPPKVIRLQGKSIMEEIPVVQRDMPNFFIEALTVSGGSVHTDAREVVVPPEKRILNVKVEPSQQEYRPGEKATVKIRLTDLQGKPFVGSTVVSIYDRSVEYISGGSNVPEIKAFFWTWRRHHHPRTESSLAGYLGNILRQGETPMGNLGIFGATVVEELGRKGDRNQAAHGFGGMPGEAPPAAPPVLAANGQRGALRDGADDKAAAGEQKTAAPNGPQPTVRKNFADTALWVGSLTTDKNGMAEVSLTMPENLTGWKIRVWAMGHGTKVGEGESIVTTKKDLLVRLQAPRFFVQKDEVVLSANVHNYLKADKTVKVSLELAGGTLAAPANATQEVSVPAGGEKRVDWRVKVIAEGDTTVRVKAIADEDADAMEMRFPSYVHGMEKFESFTGVIRPDKNAGKIDFNVPAERRANQTRLEVRYSPTLAGAMVDALPYLVDYPYGCTEQTLNRFLPTVITQRILKGMNVNLKEIKERRTNLNAQEIGDDKERAKGWKRLDRNPVFDEEEVKAMVKSGVETLTAQQLSDGGWGWFSGWGERSWPHTTAVVVHGLQIARANEVALVPGMLERGIAWLKNYQDEQVRLLKNGLTKTRPYRTQADNLDAFVYMVLVDENVKNNDMRDFIYRDRTHIHVYGKAMFGLALHKQQEADKLAMILKNIEQFLVQDDENQTAYLKLPGGAWWYWYGSENEAHAYYLKLLSKVSPKDERASRLVKYLLNNRKHATRWNSTRDTALCIEAMADYLKASGEDQPDMNVEVWLDGKKHKDVHIDRKNLFNFDNKLVLVGDAVDTGKHTIEIRRKGKGPVYFNAYLTNFTLEDFITRAGLEVKVNRKYYKLVRADKKVKVPGSRNQPLDQRVERYERFELPNLSSLKSGDLVEIELEIESKNDYEYLIFEDMKPSGFEPLLIRSGYNANDMGAYMELRDEKVCFFVRQLARGQHSMRYRMRAETPGRFSALPTRAYAMYAPELRGNSDEIKLIVGE
jgi:uncharacterized protein YfaS (alpha-2-macroglobulin family)